MVMQMMANSNTDCTGLSSFDKNVSHHSVRCWYSESVRRISHCFPGIRRRYVLKVYEVRSERNTSNALRRRQSPLDLSLIPFLPLSSVSPLRYRLSHFVVPACWVTSLSALSLSRSRSISFSLWNELQVCRVRFFENHPLLQSWQIIFGSLFQCCVVWYFAHLISLCKRYVWVP